MKCEYVYVCLYMYVVRKLGDGLVLAFDLRVGKKESETSSLIIRYLILINCINVVFIILTLMVDFAY